MHIVCGRIVKLLTGLRYLTGEVSKGYWHVADTTLSLQSVSKLDTGPMLCFLSVETLVPNASMGTSLQAAPRAPPSLRHKERTAYYLPYQTAIASIPFLLRLRLTAPYIQPSCHPQSQDRNTQFSNCIATRRARPQPPTQQTTRIPETHMPHPGTSQSANRPACEDQQRLLTAHDRGMA